MEHTKCNWCDREVPNGTDKCPYCGRDDCLEDYNDKKCPREDCPLGLLCVKSCYWWNEKDECDWNKRSEIELKRGTQEQLRLYKKEVIK